jgi:hypothetical protein
MAFCSNCGAQVPDGAAFCDSCGARLESARRPSAPAAKGSKKGLLIGLAAVLVIGLVIGVLFLTGVLGAKGPVGTWETYLYDRDDAIVMLCLNDDGTGYATLVTATPVYNPALDAYSNNYNESKSSLTWNRTQIILDDGGKAFEYVYDSDSLTLMIDGQAIPYTPKK